jgi:uncharacterized protein YeeX (DUF496 family)
MMLNLKVARTVRDDYERRAKQFCLRKLAKVSRQKTPFTRKLIWLGKDLTYLVFRLVRKRKTA